MKPFVWFVLFISIAILGDRLGGAYLRRINEQSQFRYSRLYTGRAQADLVFVGNSRGLTFYQPYIEQITGKSTANLSYNGLPAPLARALMADYVERYPNKPHFIIDVSLCDRPNGPLTAGFTAYTHASKHLDTLLRHQNGDAWWGSRASALFRYNNEVFQRALYYRNRSDEDWLLDRQVAPALAATVPLDTFPISVQPTLVRHLAEGIRIVRDAGCPVTLVLGPYYPGMVKDWTNLRAVCRAVEVETGLRVHDYSQSLPDPADFGDLMHPNKRGAQKFIDLMVRDSIIR
jgi:hypothetical protein